MTRFWKVLVTNTLATKGELVPVTADTEELAIAIALDITPGNLDEAAQVYQITEAEFDELTTPPVIPPPVTD